MNFSRLLIAIFVLLMLGGCTGSAYLSDSHLVELNQIPVLPDLTIYEGPEEITFDTLLLAAQYALEDQPKRMESQYYWIPDTLAWEAVETFYEEVFANSGWRRDSIGVRTTRWMQTQGANRQVLVLSAVPLATNDKAILLMLLVSP
ncbi:MAG: hypothetical protein AB1649_26590 [Chloroflexota bacterium]